VRKSQLLQSKVLVGTDWQQLIDQLDKKIIPTFLIREIHFIHPGCPDVIMGLGQLDSDTLALLGDTVQYTGAHSDTGIRVVIDCDKLQAHVEPVVCQILQFLP